LWSALLFKQENRLYNSVLCLKEWKIDISNEIIKELSFCVYKHSRNEAEVVVHSSKQNLSEKKIIFANKSFKIGGNPIKNLVLKKFKFFDGGLFQFRLK
jgi:hypothetical protein